MFSPNYLLMTSFKIKYCSRSLTLLANLGAVRMESEIRERGPTRRRHALVMVQWKRIFSLE